MSHIFYLLIFAGQMSGYPQVPAEFHQGYAYATMADCQTAKAVSLATGMIGKYDISQRYVSGDFVCLTLDLGQLYGASIPPSSTSGDSVHPPKGGDGRPRHDPRPRTVVAQSVTKIQQP